MFELVHITRSNYKQYYELYINRHLDNSYYSNNIKYKPSNKFVDFFTKEYRYIVNFNNTSVGFIIIKIIDNATLKIIDFNLESKYYSKFDFSKFSIFKNKVLLFSTLCINNIEDLSYKNSLIELKSNYLLQNSISYLNYEIDYTNLQFKTFQLGYDEELRCKLQNNIFYSKERIPLTLDDIKYEVNSSTFIKDLSFFMYYKDIPIGYGQVIPWNGKYLIVNFGIIENFRRRGCGKKFLIYILNSMRLNNIKKIYIKVDLNNIPALNLYLNCGFRKIGVFKDFITQIK